MKKGRFLWSAHRITEKQKAGKARNIKGKQLKNSRSTVTKPHDVRLCGAMAPQRALFDFHGSAPLPRPGLYVWMEAGWRLAVDSPRSWVYISRWHREKASKAIDEKTAFLTLFCEGGR